MFNFRIWAGGHLIREFNARESDGVRWAERWLARSPHRSCNVQAFRHWRERFSVTVTKGNNTAAHSAPEVPSVARGGAH